VKTIVGEGAKARELLGLRHTHPNSNLSKDSR